ncbi:MAG: hypothetical protein ACTHOO_07605 [Alcanivorax sp.]
MAGGVIVRGLSGAWNVGKSILGRNMTLGTTLGVASLPITVPLLDNATGNVASEALLNSPLGKPLETLLEINEFTKGQQASMVSNAIETVMSDNGQLDESSPDYETSTQIIEVVSHAVVGDEIGAYNKASAYGLDPSDVMEAYNEERARNPDARLRDIGAATVQNAARRVQERKEELARNGERRLTDGFVTESQIAGGGLAAVTLNEVTTAPSQNRDRAPETDRTQMDVSTDIDQLSSDSLSRVFDAATDRMGFMGMIVKGISALAGIFGQNAKDGFQRMVLGSVESETKYAALQSASQAGNLVSRMGNPFNLGRDQNLTLEHG